MHPPSGRVLPVSDSHDSPICPAGKSSFNVLMSTGRWWNDARHPQCSTLTVILNILLPEGQRMKPRKL